MRKLIFQYRLFGIVELAYSDSNCYYYPIAVCFFDRVIISLKYGIKLI